MEIRRSVVPAGGLEFAALEVGSGPLALCLHGFPDTAHTWRHLLPELAAAGFRAVAVFQRGYAPTQVPPDGRYQTGALAADALALHEALGGDGDAVLVGHDWGAMASYAAAAYAPDRWRRLVTMGVPPAPTLAAAFFSYPQLRRSFYVFLFQTPLAEVVLAADGLAFLDGLWRDWAPGYDASEDLGYVKEALREPANQRAAIGYYRAMLDASVHAPELAGQQAAALAVAPQPTLYLHGREDAALGVELVAGCEAFLAAGSR
ncbi:MAG: alpha/beta fold hydrolase, partial [Mycobacteriales bacterium]